MRGDAVHRPYHPGEDMSKFNAGVIVCQARSNAPRGYIPICAKDTLKVGRYRFAGGWHDVYRCVVGHQFGVLTKGEPPRQARTVVDVPNEKPVFGGGDQLRF